MLARGRRPPAAPSGTVEFGTSAQAVGWIVAIDERGCALVDFPGNCAGPLSARSLQRCTPAELAAAGPRPAVLLGFEGIDTSRPIVLGLLQEHFVAPTVPTAPAAAPALPRTARVDGRRVELAAQEELELRCGRACITLRADGTIVIRGGELHSRASGRNRITGSTVAIN